MTLTARLSVFFLVTLGLVLLGFATTLYLSARTYLHSQVDAQLEATLNTLIAAAEIGPKGVVWEPRERRLPWVQETEPGNVRWQVRDERGQIIDAVPKLNTDTFFAETSRDPPEGEAIATRAWHGQLWRLSSRRILPDVKAPAEDSKAAAPDEHQYAALDMTAGVSLDPAQATLRALAASLVAIALVPWLLAAFVGRSLCRRALRPLTQMAEAARVMGTDLERRLPASDNGDEVADLGTAFNGLLDRLAESFDRQRQFTGDASHQLRTPLTAMLGHIEVALRRERPVDEYRRVLHSVRRQALALREIVEMLLFLARADADAHLPRLERFDLGTWLEAHVASWSEHARARDLRLALPGEAAVWAEAQQPLLGQLVDNLLENACNCSKAGTPIILRVGRDGATAFLTIEDQGRGIEPQDLPHIFEPFYRSARTRQLGQDGTGLGLAIADRIARAFGGKISVTTEVGRGSCFCVSLKEASGPATGPDRPNLQMAGRA